MRPLKSGDKVLFIGNSITDCYRREEHKPLGNGYVLFFKDHVNILRPDIKLTIINKGISGNTIIDLKEGWEDDVIYNAP